MAAPSKRDGTLGPAVCTIVAKNYLAYARTLMKSLRLRQASKRFTLRQFMFEDRSSYQRVGFLGWNLGLEKGGTLGLAIATVFIIVMYVTFTFSYTELACAIPKAGGGFDYATRALGKDWGFIAGMAQNIEFIFAPPAIAFAIGAYFNLFFPQLPVLSIAIFSYVIFTALNIYGVRAAATFELIITIFAVGELLLFSGITLPHFELKNLQHNAFPTGWAGAFAATPFAIWFFLAIEGVANVAEEAVNPQRTMLLGFGSAILTLVILCVLTFISSVGVAGWEAIVYKPNGDTSDSPLPLALSSSAASSSRRVCWATGAPVSTSRISWPSRVARCCAAKG